MKPTEITEASSRTDENSVISGQVLFSVAENSEREGGKCVVSLQRCSHERDAARENGMNVVEISLGRDTVVCRRKSGFWSRIVIRILPFAELRSHKHQQAGNLLIDFLGTMYSSFAGRKFIKTNTKRRWGRRCFAFKKQLWGCLSSLINIQGRLIVILSHYKEEWPRNRLFMNSLWTSERHQQPPLSERYIMTSTQNLLIKQNEIWTENFLRRHFQILNNISTLVAFSIAIALKFHGRSRDFLLLLVCLRNDLWWNHIWQRYWQCIQWTKCMRGSKNLSQL